MTALTKRPQPLRLRLSLCFLLGLAAALGLAEQAFAAAPSLQAGDAGTGMAVVLPLFGLLLVLAACIALERVLAHGLQALMQRMRPMIGGQEAVSRLLRYERSIFTYASSDANIVLTGVAVAALSGWLGWNGHALFSVLAVGAFLASLAWDLWSWECVVVSRWQLAWRRGWRRSVRRLPLIQVAEVHVVERRLSLPWSTAARNLGYRYLAVELHNGKALKLPVTGALFGGASVERVGRHLQRTLRIVERERRLAVRQQLLAMRRAQPLAPDADELALRRELSLLRVRALRSSAPGQSPLGLGLPVQTLAPD